MIEDLDSRYDSPEVIATRIHEKLKGFEWTIREKLYYCVLAAGQLAVGLDDEDLIESAKELNRRLYALHYNSILEEDLNGIHEENSERSEDEEVPGETG